MCGFPALQISDFGSYFWIETYGKIHIERVLIYRLHEDANGFTLIKANLLIY